MHLPLLFRNTVQHLWQAETSAWFLRYFMGISHTAPHGTAHAHEGLMPNDTHAVRFIQMLGPVLYVVGCSASTEGTDAEPESTQVLEESASHLTPGERASIARGRVAFFDEKPHAFGTNNRACSTCHMLADAFQLSPANVEERFQALEARRRKHPKADDPLFRPIDADDFRIHGASANDYTNLRRNALVRISFLLPSTVKLIDPATDAPSAETFVDVWRAVPTIFNVKLTGADPNPPSWPCAFVTSPDPTCVPRGPNPNGGYQRDARIGTLQEQALSAFLSHAEATAAPPARMLDDLANFQNAQFSSDGIRAMSRAIDEGTVPIPDPDPRLDALEQQGKDIFALACRTCHDGAPGTLPFPGIQRFGAINTACPRPVDGPSFPGYTGTPRFAFAPCSPELEKNVRVYEITLANGTKVRRASSDPGRTLLTGFFLGATARDDWQALDVPSIRGMSKTAPYFHNNSAATLDDLLDHYREFFKFAAATAPTVGPTGTPLPRPRFLSTDGIHDDRPFTAEERPALLAYLRKL